MNDPHHAAQRSAVGREERVVNVAAAERPEVGAPTLNPKAPAEVGVGWFVGAQRQQSRRDGGTLDGGAGASSAAASRWLSSRPALDRTVTTVASTLSEARRLRMSAGPGRHACLTSSDAGR